MAGVNKVILLGRLGKNPETTYTPNGTAVCKFTLATSKKRKDGNEVTSWHRCTAFGKTGEIIGQYMSVGRELYVEGELSYGQYEKNGVMHYTTDIIVREFNFVAGSNNSQHNPKINQNGYGNQSSNGQQRQNGNNQVPPDDDIPF